MKMSARIAKYRFWKRKSCYLYDHPFGSIYVSPMMAIMQQRVKSRKRHSLTWRQCPKGVDPSLIKKRSGAWSTIINDHRCWDHRIINILCEWHTIFKRHRHGFVASNLSVVTTILKVTNPSWERRVVIQVTWSFLWGFNDSMWIIEFSKGAV